MMTGVSASALSSPAAAGADGVSALGAVALPGGSGIAPGVVAAAGSGRGTAKLAEAPAASTAAHCSVNLRTLAGVLRLEGPQLVIEFTGEFLKFVHFRIVQPVVLCLQLLLVATTGEFGIELVLQAVPVGLDRRVIRLDRTLRGDHLVTCRSAAIGDLHGRRGRRAVCVGADGQRQKR